MVNDFLKFLGYCMEKMPGMCTVASGGPNAVSLRIKGLNQRTYDELIQPRVPEGALVDYHGEDAVFIDDDTSLADVVTYIIGGA